MKRTWTEQDLREAIASSFTKKEAIEKMGLKYSSSASQQMSRWINTYEIDITHFNRKLPHRRKWTTLQLQKAVETSKSFFEVAKKLSLTTTGTMLKRIRGYADDLKLDYSHFHKREVAGGGRCLKEILVKDSPHRCTNSLKKRLVKEGLFIYKCSSCGIKEWQGKPIALQMDHINGINSDNRLENLRLLCPNCHSQTETWGNKNNAT